LIYIELWIIGGVVCNKIIKYLCQIAVLGLVSTIAFADNNDAKTLTVGGKIVRQLELGITSDLGMPDLVKPDTGESTFVDLHCPNSGGSTVTYDALGGNPFPDGTAAATAVAAGSANAAYRGTTSTNVVGTCGALTALGEPNFYYTVTTTIDPPNPSAGITVTSVTCAAVNGGKITLIIPGLGSGTIICGAKITADDTVSPGAYSRSATVAVVYD
jgi:hypothetical protein